MKGNLNIEFVKKINELAVSKTKFFVVIDFEKKKPLIFQEKNLLSDCQIKFKIGNHTNYKKQKFNDKIKSYFEIIPLEFSFYKKIFNKVKRELRKGNTYLLNLTFSTQIKLKTSMERIFFDSKSNYKLYFKNSFLCFSPECFIKIKKNKIFSYPMKGTIRSDLKNAKKRILNDNKEIEEHSTIVDLIRNDMSIFAKKVKVNKFRFLKKINSSKSPLLQVSSEIEGKLGEDWRNYLGEIIWEMLPAGSISGAPKNKTIEIIEDVEMHKRGYYTGIFGYYDGETFDSAVTIRYIEKLKNKYFYKSGGGITYNSKIKNEYKELINKIYVPII